jgi:predicted metal-dependent peptidase
MDRPTALTPEQTAELVIWRAEALEKMPYLASVLLNLRPLNAPGLGTFACDKNYRLYIDFDAVTEWGVQMCAEALLHECGHMFGDHSERAEEYGVADSERGQWNIAGDAEINDDLAEAGCDTIAENGVTPEKLGQPDFQTAEFYMASFPKPPAGQPQSGGQPGAGDPGDGEPFAGCGSCSGGETAPGELAPDDDADGAAPAATDGEKKIIAITTATNIRDHAAKYPGKTPKGLVERANVLLAPSKLPWRALLSASLRRAVAQRSGDFDVTFSRRNRRRSAVEIAPGRRVIYPGSYSPIPNIAVVRDTSGSMSESDLALVSNEIEGIAKQLGVRGNDLRILDVDSEVGSVKRYQGAVTLEEVTGRGGTDMGVGIAAACALRPTPNAVVVVTDGYTPWPATKPRIPVVVCIVGDGDLGPIADEVPDWAVTVEVDSPVV